jgi:hypothetical protein
MKSTRYADVPNSRNGFTQMGKVSEKNTYFIAKGKIFLANLEALFFSHVWFERVIKENAGQ